MMNAIKELYQKHNDLVSHLALLRTAGAVMLFLLMIGIGTLFSIVSSQRTQIDALIAAEEMK